MAFHPFGIVRKHQKVLLALATIFCMGVFILQFGRGDLIESLLGGGGQGKGEKLVALYGKNIYPADVVRDRQSRQAASELVQDAVMRAAQDAQKNVTAYNPDKPDAADDRLKQLRGFLDPNFLLQSLMQERRSIDDVIGKNVAELDAILGELASSDKTDKGKAADQTRMAKDLRLLFKFQYLQFTSGPGALYFGGGVKDEDILDFEIWKHQADKLGVVLTKADARRAVSHEAGDRDLPADPGASWAADPLIKSVLDQHPQMTEDQLATAVADEFRVEIAQNLLAGRGAGVPAVGMPDLTAESFAPYDFWTYFRDNRTTVKAAFLPIPVQAFTDKVTVAPDGGELDKLYNQYRSKVPDPNSPTPGFKEPRRIRIETITARTDSDYYKELVDRVQYNRVRRAFYAALPGNTAAGGVVPWLSLAGAGRRPGERLPGGRRPAGGGLRGGAGRPPRGRGRGGPVGRPCFRRAGRVVGRAGPRPGVRRRPPARGRPDGLRGVPAGPGRDRLRRRWAGWRAPCFPPRPGRNQRRPRRPLFLGRAAQGRGAPNHQRRPRGVRQGPAGRHQARPR